MSTSRSLPHHRRDAWQGGFVVADPAYTTSVAAAGGLVVAATEQIYRILPGAMHCHTRATPEGYGDALCVAVEPRRPGRPSRFAVATGGGASALHLFDGQGVASLEFPEDHGEVLGLMWAPAVTGGDSTPSLHVRFGERLLRLVEGDAAVGTFVECLPRGCLAMASDGDGGVALASFDDEYSELEVSIPLDLGKNEWGSRAVPTPDFFTGARIAVAGRAVAVSFVLAGGVWLTRDITQHPFVELEELRATRGPTRVDELAALAFEGATPDAALFASVRETAHRSAIVRIDAAGRVQRIGEVTDEGGAHVALPHVRQMAWDPTRRTLWSAVGRAGLLCSTEPGSPVPVGATAGAGAAS